MDDGKERRPGRPRRPGGPDPVRSFRSGDVYDQAVRIAKTKGDSLTAVLNAALEAYVAASAVDGGD